MDKFKKILHPIKKPFDWFKRTRKRNKIFVVIALLIIGFIAYRQVLGANAQPLYETQVVERNTVTEQVSETGNVATAGIVDVSSPTTGIIDELYVENGDSVTVNQALFKVRSIASDQEKAAAYAAYQNALSSQKTAEQSKLTLDAQMWQAQQGRFDAQNSVNNKNVDTTNPTTREGYTQLEKESIDAGAVQAEKNFRALEKKVLEANSSISAAKAQVSSTWLAYQATQTVTVKAPTAGSVNNLSLTIGDKVSSSSLAGAAATTQPILLISNVEDYTIKLSLNEVDIPQVKQGQTVIISLDAVQQQDFKGTVTHVDAIGINNQGVVTYNIVATINDPSDQIRPGMTANVDIEVSKAENVLTVPNSAIKPYQGGRAVQVIDPTTDELKYIPVEVGIRSPERTEIKSGVEEGTEIVTAIKNSNNR